MVIICSSCGVIKTDYGDLAKHIVASRKGHEKGKVWAHKFLLKPNILNRKVEALERLKQRRPLTEAEKENKRNSKVELSGEDKSVVTLCPKCGSINDQDLPVEYVSDVYTWKFAGQLVVSCENCSGR